MKDYDVKLALYNKEINSYIKQDAINKNNNNSDNIYYNNEDFFDELI